MHTESKKVGRKLVGYVRVSTTGQAASGLGLEAQHRAIDAYATGVGGLVIAAYTEVESGRKRRRPESVTPSA